MPLMANLDNTQASSCAPHKPTSRSFFLSFSQANLLKLFVFSSSQANFLKLLPVFRTSQPLKAFCLLFLTSQPLKAFCLLFLTGQLLKASSCLPHKPTSRSFFLSSSQANFSKLLLVFFCSRVREPGS